MKYKRPNDTDSRRSWEAIWLGCMNSKHLRPSHHRPNSILTVDPKNKEYRRPKTKVRYGSSLHQQECGHGYDVTDRARLNFHNPVVENLIGVGARSNTTPLGANPREITTWVQTRKLKKY